MLQATRLSLLIVTLLLTVPALAQSQDGAQDTGHSPLDTLIPTGFGGYGLGLDADQAPELVFARTVHVQSDMEGDYDIDYHVRPGQSLNWEGIRLKSVEYGFCEGTLCSILVEAPGREAFQAILDRYRSQYGIHERTAFAYDTVWVRQYHEDAREYGSNHSWILCERETDNCVLASVRWYENEQLAVLNIGQQLDY